MRSTKLVLICLLFSISAQAQLAKKLRLHGMYLQWGYCRDWFSNSDIRFTNGNKYDFTIHKATAKDKPDFSGFWTSPWNVTIPQNCYRIGFYLNAAHTHAFEINYDHAKYVMEDNKVRRVSGNINGESFDHDTLVTRDFISFEHTNGANFYNFNYVGQRDLLHKGARTLASMVWKAGAGFVMPRSDVGVMGNNVDNHFHIAGYILSLEAGARYYPFPRCFAELTVKGGFANYLDVLTVAGGKANHEFYYAAAVGLIGYEFPLNQRRYGFKPKKQ